MVIGLLILFGTVILGIVGIKYSDWELWDTLHAKIGVSIISVIAFVNLTGIFLRTRIFKRIPLFWIHKVMGYTTYTLA